MEKTRNEICPKYFEQKKIAFDCNQKMILIMYTNARFRSTGTTDFGTKFTQNYMNDKTFKKINIKIIITI